METYAKVLDLLERASIVILHGSVRTAAAAITITVVGYALLVMSRHTVVHIDDFRKTGAQEIAEIQRVMNGAASSDDEAAKDPKTFLLPFAVDENAPDLLTCS